MQGKRKRIAGATQTALGEGCKAPDVLKAVIDALAIVSDKFKNNETFVPEMLIAAKTMKKELNFSSRDSRRMVLAVRGR